MLANIFSNDNAWLVIWISAVLSSLIGVGFLLHSTYIARYWPKAIGRVTANTSSISHHDSGQSTVYFALIKFRAADGQDYEIRSDVGQQKPWSLGQDIMVHYKPTQPNHAMTMRLWERLVFSGVFIAFAIVCWGLITGYISR